MTKTTKITRLISVLSVPIILCISPTVSKAQETSAEFFRKDKEYWSKGLKAPEIEKYEYRTSPTAYRVDDHQQAVANAVAQTVQSRIGNQWVDTALKITKVESGFRCNAVGPRVRGGRARGAMQVMPGTAVALGYAPSQLTDCRVGIEAGVAHMVKCLESGVTTPSQMAACHVAGTEGWKSRLRKKSERYKHQYVRMVMLAK